MSIFNCSDVCNSGTPTTVSNQNSRRIPIHHLFQQIHQPNEDGWTLEDKQKKQEMDNLLAQALNQLTVDERKEHQEVLHGVNDTIVDDGFLLDSSLEELNSQLTNTINTIGTVYEMAKTMDPEYVRARAFRAMFLRANEYDAKAAADQMLTFFDTKYRLFGKDKLVKDITIADLDENDLFHLKASILQVAGRDRSGRQVFFHLGGSFGEIAPSSETVDNLLRAQYYVTMKALMQSEEAQIRGIVSIWYALGNLEATEPTGWFESFVELERALPQKKAAIHVCVDDMQHFALCSAIVKKSKTSVMARTSLHYGSLTECKDQLSTFGILPQALPTDNDGNVTLDRHQNWIQDCATEEKSRRPTPSLKKALSLEPTPNENDVLFTGSQVLNHVGNHRFRTLVQNFLDEYGSGTDKEKRQIVGEVVFQIHEAEGRFLKPKGKVGSDIWEEVPIEKLRKKIMQTFRNRRRLYDDTSNPRTSGSLSIGTLISGEPLPPDVLFGRVQRNPGNDVLHNLVVAHFDEYESLNRGVKMKLVEGIMRTIKDQGGRFLEPAQEEGRWVELQNDHHARERISTHFRNYRRTFHK